MVSNQRGKAIFSSPTRNGKSAMRTCIRSSKGFAEHVRSRFCRWNSIFILINARIFVLFAFYQLHKYYNVIKKTEIGYLQNFHQIINSKTFHALTVLEMEMIKDKQ